MEPCIMCGGTLIYIGDLGMLTMYRCRQCGADQSIDTDEEED